MAIPSANSQLEFLQNVQAVLEDGQFVATYKFALLSRSRTWRWSPAWSTTHRARSC